MDRTLDAVAFDRDVQRGGKRTPHRERRQRVDLQAARGVGHAAAAAFVVAERRRRRVVVAEVEEDTASADEAGHADAEQDVAEPH